MIKRTLKVYWQDAQQVAEQLLTYCNDVVLGQVQDDGWVSITYHIEQCDCGRVATSTDSGGEYRCDACRQLEEQREVQDREPVRYDDRFLIESCIMFNERAEAWLKRRCK